MNRKSIRGNSEEKLKDKLFVSECCLTRLADSVDVYAHETLEFRLQIL